jgi:hypothetical protein
MPSVLNAKASQALRGQSAIVTIDNPSVNGYPQAEWLNSAVSIGLSGNVGTITSVDVNGISFKVTPIQPNLRFDSASAPGILVAGETIEFL